MFDPKLLWWFGDRCGGAGTFIARYVLPTVSYTRTTCAARVSGRMQQDFHTIGLFVFKSWMQQIMGRGFRGPMLKREKTTTKQTCERCMLEKAHVKKRAEVT